MDRRECQHCGLEAFPQRGLKGGELLGMGYQDGYLRWGVVGNVWCLRWGNGQWAMGAQCSST